VRPVVVRAPLDGVVVPLDMVPDPVFAEILVGPGVAIQPASVAQVILAPMTGRLLKLKPHAFVVADGHRAVLVHLGIDTVRLNGAASQLLTSENQQVEAGDPVMFWNPAQVTAAGLSCICPVVALDAPADALGAVAEGRVAAGADLFTWLPTSQWSHG
jgi:PTS system glucose-specific IIA component